MGYGRSGAIPCHYVRLLSWRRRCAARLRHCQAFDVRECGAMAARAARPCRSEHCHYAGGQQERLAAFAYGADGGVQIVCRTQLPELHRDVGAGLVER